MIILCWTIEPELWLIYFLVLSFCSVVPALPVPPCVQTGEGGPHPLASCTGHHTVKVSRRGLLPSGPALFSLAWTPSLPKGSSELVPSASHPTWSPHPSKASTLSVPSASAHHLHSSDPTSRCSPTSQNSSLCHLNWWTARANWCSEGPYHLPDLIEARVLPMDITSPAALFSGCGLLSLFYYDYVIIIINSPSASTTGPWAWGECPPSTPLQLPDRISSIFLRTPSSCEFCAFRLYFPSLLLLSTAPRSSPFTADQTASLSSCH